MIHFKRERQDHINGILRKINGKIISVINEQYTAKGSGLVLRKEHLRK